MKISYVIEPYFSVGGCQRQLESWKRNLHLLGLDVSLDPNISNSDAIHFFPINNLQMFNQIRRGAKSKSIVSCNYWSNSSKFYSFAKKMTLISPAIFNNIRPVAAYRERYEFFRNCNSLIANTKAESELIQFEYGIDNNLIHVIPNTVDDIFFEHESISPNEKNPPYLLTIATIDPRKNQHLVAHVAKKLKIEYHIYGSVFDKNYLERILKIGGGFVKYKGLLVHGSPQMLAAIDGCSLYLLPSWWETPGISAMEAAVRNRPIIVTDVGGAREYFGDFASYSDGESLDQMMVEKMLCRVENSIVKYVPDYKTKFRGLNSALLLRNLYNYITEMS
ncbi:glycosyltransferase family 4 protein [Polynucleobacter sp. TSB-Sco08W16]|uniref:glycosyltransferase family 4 protein n=1 Tax=Polynucleobacter sp. TSB-Sco08W16 TaxID=1758374 RepID=UPI001BFEA657|nr:glycosyltransferase family 4 protein [Polynucleobacter sp. TSB-Sco08W16]QWD74561.1 glycosyltransferase family 4 protein [Polynucleobacter sp. TSB-Sco08W16]